MKQDIDSPFLINQVPTPYLWAIIGCGLAALLILLAFCVYCYKRRARRERKLSMRDSKKKKKSSSTKNKSHSTSDSTLLKSAPDSVFRDSAAPPTRLFTSLAAMKILPHTVQPDVQSAPPFNPTYKKFVYDDEIPAVPTRSTEDLGKFYFAIRFDTFTSTLIVHVQKATGLQAVELLREVADPYVELHLYPGKKQILRTKIRRRTLNPVWNEEFNFEGLNHEDVREKTLYIDVKTSDKFSRCDVLGATELILRSVSTDKDPQQLQHALHPSKNSRIYLGDLLLSLCYAPRANTISVLIMKCRRLRYPERCLKKPFPYIKVNLYHLGKIFAKKKTTVSQEPNDPIWNELLVFDTPIEKIRGLTFEFKIMDSDSLIMNKHLGKVMVGHLTTGSTLKHWTDVLTNTNKTIASWHTIYKY